MKVLLTWFPILAEAWESSGKKKYTYKTNRTPLILLILIGIIGYFGYQEHEQNTQLQTTHKEAIAKLKSEKETEILKNKQLSMENEHLEELQLELKDTLEMQNSTMISLRNSLVSERAKVTSIELEKQSVENLLVASANQNRQLTEKIDEFSARYQSNVKSKLAVRTEARRLYDNLMNKRK